MKHNIFENIDWETAGKASMEDLKERTLQMLDIASRFLSEYEMSNVIRPFQDQCFVIYFMGRILGKFNDTAVVINPMAPSKSYNDTLDNICQKMLNDDTTKTLMADSKQTMEKLFALGVHVSNIEDQKVSSAIIRMS